MRREGYQDFIDACSRSKKEFRTKWIILDIASRPVSSLVIMDASTGDWKRTPDRCL